MNPTNREPAPARRRIRRFFLWVPNALTLGNSLCGFLAILWTLTVYNHPGDNPLEVFSVSVLIILGAMIFDAFDGYSARLLGASSMCGVEMDSLADMVTFGVAPAVVMAIMTQRLQVNQTAAQTLVTYALCSVYVGCAALRLANYNVHALQPKEGDEKEDKTIFHGLPSPGAAAAICSLVLAFRNYGGDVKHLAAFLPFYAAVLGLLMVSSLPYFHVGRWLLSSERHIRKILTLLVVILLLVLFKETAVFALVSLYVLTGPVGGCRRRFRRNRK